MIRGFYGIGWRVAIVWLVLLLAGCSTPAGVGGERARVVAVVDGDTIDVLLGGQTQRVRYILINTPEAGEPFGAAATAANRALVEDKTVTLVKDVSETDRFGRLLRYVYLPDGGFVNAELVRQGYAQLATFPPDVAQEATIRAAQQEAMAAGRGIWRTTDGAVQRCPGGQQPPDPACAIKGNISASDARIYHLPGQRDYCATVIRAEQGERWFCTAEEAEAAGWRPAVR
jgi:micrococcal nuclease